MTRLRDVLNHLRCWIISHDPEEVGYEVVRAGLDEWTKQPIYRCRRCGADVVEA